LCGKCGLGALLFTTGCLLVLRVERVKCEEESLWDEEAFVAYATGSPWAVVPVNLKAVGSTDVKALAPGALMEPRVLEGTPVTTRVVGVEAQDYSGSVPDGVGLYLFHRHVWAIPG